MIPHATFKCFFAIKFHEGDILQFHQGIMDFLCVGGNNTGIFFFDIADGSQVFMTDCPDASSGGEVVGQFG